MTREEAQKFIEAVKAIRENADEKTASVAVDIYPTLKGNGELIKAGTRIHFGGTLFKAAVDLWDREENNPENAPTLWEEIQYHEGVRIIPEVITVTTAFAKGELGYWKANGKTYKSLIDANVYTPAAYPQGWEEIQ
jgi:hypothetical protein